MQSSVKERLIEFIKSQGLSQGRFEKLLGFSNGYVNNISKGIGGDKLQKIICEFPQLNIDWLLSGNGNMLVGSKEILLPNVEVPREVFDKLVLLIETVSSQQGTIADQQRMNSEQGKLIADMYQKIDRLTSSGSCTARTEYHAECAASK